MPNFLTVLEEAIQSVRASGRGGCDLLERLSGKSFGRSGEFNELNAFLENKGFKDFKFLGSGSHAAVVSVADNPDIVIRLEQFPGDRRFRLPYMLQPIGQPQHLCAIVEDGQKRGGFNLEFLKRLDMNVAPDALDEFKKTTHRLGYRLGSFERNSEVGWYRYKNMATRGERSVLMACDPGALERGTAKDLAVNQGYPSLKEQYAENLRIARNDPRLSFLVPDIERQLEEAPVCRNAMSEGWTR